MAAKMGYDYFEPTKGNVGGWFQNLGWMVRQVLTKDFILDIGPVPGTKPSRVLKKELS